MKAQKIKPLEAEKRLQDNFNRINNFVDSLFPSIKLKGLEQSLLELNEDPYRYAKDDEAQRLNSERNN